MAVTGDTGVMIVSAGNDVNLGGATIEALGKEGAITITAGHDINSTTDTLTAKKDMTQDGDNYLRTYRQTELGTTIEAGGNVSIGAKNDIKARNLTVSSDSGAVKVIGEHDVSIENGYSESKDAFALTYKEKGFLNKKETKIKTNDESKHALMSTVSGHTVVVGANNDVALTSSNVVSTAGTSVLAGHNVTTDAAAEHTLSTASKDVKKSGIMGAGMGIMIGKKQSKDNYSIDETTHKATTLGSTDGKVTVQAGDTVHLTTTDIIADKGIKLSGQDIVLDGKEDHYLSKESHEYKSSGLTVSLGGSVANAINTAYGLQQKAKGREDKRLAALEYMETGKELKTAAANIHDYTSYTAGSVLKKGTELKELGQAQLASAQELKNASLMNRYANTATANVTDYKTKVGEANISKGNAELADLDNNQAGYKAKKRAKADNLVNIRVSIGSSSSRSESSYEANTFDGGSMESNGDIIIEANSADSIKGNIKAVGETISGKTVKLMASNDVSLQAATNTSENLENAKSKGWSVGANISVAGGGILGFDASANAAKQKSNTKVTTHTGTTVVGSDAVTITSGKDTHISGSKVVGKSVTADVGGNLSIESLQDTKTYVGESSNKGFSVSTNAGSLSNVSMSSSKGKMKSDYASVTDQAGIYAGDGGFVINTAETTSLRGAVIDSTADTNKNKVSTKSLDVKDVENTAEYTSRNVGMSYNHVGNFKNLSKAGKDAVWNTLGTLPNLLPDSSKSSSSTTKSAISNGTIEVRDANFNMQTLSRDTKDSLNKLDEIFDKKKVEERQELSKLFAKEAFGQLHNWNPTSKEGKAAKAIAHGVVAEVSARMAGNKPGSGFYAGATNEALIGEIQKIAKEKPDVAQTLSALLGAAVNGSLGYSSVTGAAEAQYGTKWNQSGVMPKNKDYVFVRYDGQIWKRSALGSDTFLGGFGVWNYVNPGDVYVVQRSRPGEQAMGDEYRYDGNMKSTYVPGDGGNIEVGINEAYASGFNAWDPSKNPALPFSTATGTWADYKVKVSYNYLHNPTEPSINKPIDTTYKSELRAYPTGEISAPVGGSYSVDKLDGTSTYLIGRINGLEGWSFNGPDFLKSKGTIDWEKGSTSLGKIQGSFIDTGLHFDHKDRLFNHADAHIVGVQGKVDVHFNPKKKVGVEADALVYALSGEAATEPLKLGPVQVSLEAEGYVGAIGAKAHGYIDLEKKKLEGKIGLAGVLGGSIGVVVEENEDRKKDRKN